MHMHMHMHELKHKQITRASVCAAIATLAILGGDMIPVGAAPKALAAYSPLPSPMQRFHFTVRPYTIGGRTLNIYTGPANCTGGTGIATGLDNLLWSTLTGTGCGRGDIVSFTTGGSAVAYPLPTVLAAPSSIVESADAAHMWFTASSGSDRLGAITAGGMITGFPVPGSPATSGISTGPDKRLYFGAGAGHIGASTTAGTISLYPLPSASDLVGSTAVGSDGAVWYSNAGANGAKFGLGKITTAGNATDYQTNFATSDVVAGADGNTWFTVTGTSAVGFISTGGGAPTLFTSGISGIPNQIVTGRDGNEYFDEIVPATGQSAVAKITLTGVVTEYALPYGFTPGGITVGPDKNIWVTDVNHDQIGQLVIPQNVWTNLAPMPTARTGACAGVIGTTAYVVGGLGSNGTILNVNEAYNSVTNSWSTAAAMPTGLWTAACAVVGKTLYVIGGASASAQTTNIVEAYNAVTNTWSSNLRNLPTPTNSFSAASYDGLVYVVGGYTGIRTTGVEAYNPSTNAWTNEAPLNVGRSYVGLGTIGSTLIAADGLANSGGSTDTESYSPAQNAWTIVAPSPQAKYNVCAAAINGSLYVAGGSNGSPLASLAIYVGATNRWSSGPSMNKAVTLAAGADVNGQLVCFGGSNSDFGGTVYNSVQAYQP